VVFLLAQAARAEQGNQTALRFYQQTGKLEQGPTTTKLIAAPALIMIKFQVTVIYFQAAVAKFKVSKWVDGMRMGSTILGLIYLRLSKKCLMVAINS
jgi:hypothetical protein